MSTFMVWIGIAILFLVFYLLLLLFKYRRRARFRIKLTIIFLLFVFIPTVPLTFFAAHLLTQSADALLLPGIGSALETSLETIRMQIENQGECFFLEHENFAAWSQNLVEDEALFFLGLYRISQNRHEPVKTLHASNTPLSRDWEPSIQAVREALRQETYSHLITVHTHSMMAYYRAKADSQAAVIVYPVPNRTIQAKDEITQALGIYNTLALIKESLIQKNIIWALAVLFILGLTGLTIIVARNLSRGINEPVQKLVEAMQDVATGDLSQKVETTAKDEFRFLVDSFNTMTHDLDVSRTKLIQAERMAAWQEVARQISHEIKNSLTPITISLRRLHSHLRKENLPPAVSENLRTVEAELDALQSMAAEFSEFARMPEPQKHPLDVNEIIRSMILLMQASAGRVTIEEDLSSDLPLIKGDRQQIKRLLNNLIKNSIEASHDTGTITVATRRVRSSSHALEIQIRDQGEGIDQETLENIFQPYFTTKRKGTGLGLAIARKIVESHGGDIAVESRKGKGTTITVFL